RQAQNAHIHDRRRAGADDRAGSRYADELPTAERLDGVTENLGIDARILIAQDDDRVVPGLIDLAVLRVPRSAAARHGDGVHRLRERREQVVRGGAARIFADVDDEPVLADALGNQFFLELAEVRHAHGADVQIAQLVAGRLVNDAAVVVEPVLVEQAL